MDKKPKRRTEDKIEASKPSCKLNLDRRRINHERRAMSHNDYHGPARRLTIDRRLNVRDRREVEE